MASRSCGDAARGPKTRCKDSDCGQSDRGNRHRTTPHAFFLGPGAVLIHDCSMLAWPKDCRQEGVMLTA